MKEFCKVFNFDGIGQVVVMRDQDNNGEPCVKTTIHGGCVIDGVGLVTRTETMIDHEDADELFECISKAKAHEIAGWLFNELEDKFN